VFSGNRRLAFWAGWVTLFAALDSPLDLATGTVFSAHMVQHMLLIAVAPPLLLMGRPLPAVANAIPRAWRGRISGATHGMGAAIGWLARPLPAWLVATAFLWLWHEPHLYQAAVRREWVHIGEHLTFVGTASLYWWAIVTTVPRARALSPGMAMLSLFGMGMQGAALGALLTFSGSLWYPIYEGRSGLWHLSAMSDQTLAGLIMWIPVGSVYVIASLVVLGRWFADDADERGAVVAAGTGASS
jgi:putative membrane protein